MAFQRKLGSYLANWHSDIKRKPLILRGARQVGKTSLVKNWAAANSKPLVYINLEEARTRQLFNAVLDGQGALSLEDALRVISDNYLPPGHRLKECLIFFDEIQNIPPLLPLLRFFYEQRPELPVVAAGSYLELKIKQYLKKRAAEFAFPVGRVENLFLYPLDFFEFLSAIGEERLLKRLQDVDWKSLPTADVHLKASQMFEEYFLLGGMPEVIALRAAAGGALIENDKLQRVYSALSNGYLDDIAKYGIAEPRLKYLEHLLSHSHTSAGKLVSYEGFGGSAYRSREIGEAFEVLESVMIATLARACSDQALPWNSQERKQKKLIYLDAGLVNFQSGVTFADIKREELNQLHRGRLAEQVVGQQLLCDQVLSRGRLNYWVKDYTQGGAEVDFCIEVKGRPCGIEVKSGEAGTLKSLMEFANFVRDSILLRVYSGEMKVEDRRGVKVSSLPFYMLPRLRELASGLSYTHTY